MLLFSGARPGDLIQLKLSDFKYEKGALYADLTNCENEKRLKTKAAHRKIPIHEELIALGIERYLIEAKHLGFGRLLQEIKVGNDNVRANRNATRWFNEQYRPKYLNQNWVKQKKSLYSFRSTHITQALNNKVDHRLLPLYVGRETQMGVTGIYD